MQGKGVLQVTLIEAVAALKNGEADMISRESWDKSSQSYQFRDNGHGTLVNGHGSGPVQLEQILATDWVLMKKRRIELHVRSVTFETVVVYTGEHVPENAKFYAEWVG
jgi:hypothetical protein